EVEVEDVRLRQVPGERAPLDGLLAEESLSRQIEVDVVLVRPPLLRPEDEEARVDAFAAQGVHVGPTCTGQIDRQMEDSGIHAGNDTIRGRVRRAETPSLPRRSGRSRSAPCGRSAT